MEGEVIKVSVRNMIKKLGGKEVGGINWGHVEFQDENSAQKFVDFLETQGSKYEYRGPTKPWRKDQTWKAQVSWR